MRYKGYEAVVSFDEDNESFHGEVLNIRDVITFQGKSVKELKQAFRDSVEDYLSFCKKRGEEPNKPFSGKLVIRIDPSLHGKLSGKARKKGVSLNALIEELLAS